MKKWIFIAALALLAWQFMDNPDWQSRFILSSSTPPSSPQPADALIPPAPSAESMPSVRCDGRQYCSQMTSCAEAKAFLRSCPGMKMDGDGDGVPCEEQWCRM